MEFPNCGLQCSEPNCKQLDFLPITCSYCTKVFCKDHSNASSHACPNYVDKIGMGTEKTITYPCYYEGCKARTVVEMICEKCSQNFCLSHRFHSCFEIDEEKILIGKQKIEETKQKLSQAKLAVDKQVVNNLRKSKNTAMANKVSLFLGIY